LEFTSLEFQSSKGTAVWPEEEVENLACDVIYLFIYLISIDHYIRYRTGEVINKDNNNTTINTMIYDSNILQ
jgi:hypothetical protein